MRAKAVVLFMVIAAVWALGADSASLSVSLPTAQPAGCAVNRWMPFWVDIRGTLDFNDGEAPPVQYDCDGFELWLEYDPDQVEIDLEGDGLGDDYSYAGTVFDGLGWTPDFTGITRQTRDIEGSPRTLLHIGVTFDTASPADQSLPTPLNDAALLRLRFHAKDFSGAATMQIRSDDQEEWYSYCVKHPADSSAAPEGIAVAAGSHPIPVASENLFIRGNVTGHYLNDPIDVLPPGDPTIKIDMNDGLRLLRHLFVDPVAHPIACMEAADANDDGRVNLLDAVYVFQWVFGSAADFPPPLSHVGVDDDGDAVGCAESQM